MLKPSAVAACVAILFMIVAGCASSANAPAKSGSNAVDASIPTPPPTTPTPTTISSDSSAVDGGATGDGSFVVPNEVGKVLQDAQDDLQRVSRDPVFFSHSQDATGQGRHQILDRDWKVCSQNVAPGTRVPFDAHIVFDVVKLDETCP